MRSTKCGWQAIFLCFLTLQWSCTLSEAHQPFSKPSSLPPSLPHHPWGQTKFTAFGSQEFLKRCSNRLTQPWGWLTLNSGIYTLHDHFCRFIPHRHRHTRTHTHTHGCVMVPVSLLSKGIWLGLVCKSQFPLDNGVYACLWFLSSRCVCERLCTCAFVSLFILATGQGGGHYLQAAFVSSHWSLI